MTRLVIFLIVILAIAAGLDWLADRPGNIVVEWQGYVAETSVFRAFILLLMLLAACLVTWSALRSQMTDIVSNVAHNTSTPAA